MSNLSRITDKLIRANKENEALKERQRWRHTKDEVPEVFDLVIAFNKESQEYEIISAEVGFAFTYAHWRPFNGPHS